ncbi:MAG: hypothetical protein WAM42_19105 [Candidatus Nitrosopolaris sp.]
MPRIPECFEPIHISFDCIFVKPSARFIAIYQIVRSELDLETFSEVMPLFILAVNGGLGPARTPGGVCKD